MKDESEVQKKALKERIMNYAKEAGVDDIGFASLENYKSPNTAPIKEIFPQAKTIVVLAFQQLDNCESENERIMSMGNRNLSEFSNPLTYEIARFIKRESGSKVMTIIGGPVNTDKKTGLPVADISLRHAAFAAGLGSFGRHNLVVHPEMGSKVVFSAIITDRDIQVDTPLGEDLCIDCDICVNLCPANALNEEKKTDVMKCLLKSQPYGLAGCTELLTRFSESSLEEQKKMLQDEKYKKIYSALSLGTYYVCYNCVKSCPVGLKRT